MPNKDRAFQVFVKPTGALCNLSCDYCYYLDKKALYPGKATFRMDDAVLEKYIYQHIQATTEEVVMFSWHGGEPLLAGLDFFRKAVTIQKKYLPNGKTLVNGVQTNGVLLDDEWCSFFAKERFMAGISIDGPEYLHDYFRKNTTGQGTFKKVLRGYHLLKDYGITTEILCTVNAVNAHHPLEVYQFFKSLGIRYITFLPLVNRSSDGVTTDSVKPDDFGRFLIRIFDEWQAHDIGNLTIQLFEEAFRPALNLEHTLCVFKPVCGGVPVVEHNGDVYSCDHYVSPDYFLGNLKDQTLAWYLDSREQEAFGKAKLLSLPNYCLECPVRPMCNGECPKNRFIQTPLGEPGLNYLCAGYRMFFTHILPFTEALRTAATHSKDARLCI